MFIKPGSFFKFANYAAEETEAQQETDPHRIGQRQKQIDLGKNTLGYQRFRQQHPKYAPKMSFRSLVFKFYTLKLLLRHIL